MKALKIRTLTNHRVLLEGGEHVCWEELIQVKTLGRVFVGCRNSTGKDTEVETFRFVHGTTWGSGNSGSRKMK